MKKLVRSVCSISACLCSLTLTVYTEQQGSSPSTASKAAAPFPLTVDSIMRGPELIGYPPTDLRWSGDSKELFFEWRKAGEDQAATWKVSRDGGAPMRLSDAERRLAPLANGQWDAKRQRKLIGRPSLLTTR